LKDSPNLDLLDEKEERERGGTIRQSVVSALSPLPTLFGTKLNLSSDEFDRVVTAGGVGGDIGGSGGGRRRSSNNGVLLRTSSDLTHGGTTKFRTTASSIIPDSIRKPSTPGPSSSQVPGSFPQQIFHPSRSQSGSKSRASES